MQNQNIMTVLTFAGMIVLFYLIVFIPENKRKKKYKAMLNDLKVNDEVATRGGIIGKIVNIQDDVIILQSGPDKSRMKVSKNGIASVMSSTSQENSTK